MIIVVTGDGKGKTTSAIGQGIRVLGNGGRVFMIQFIKSHSFPSGEDKILPQISGSDFFFKKGGLGFVGILGDKLPLSEHQSAARSSLREATAAITSGEWSLVILDEINVALSLGLVDLDSVLKLLDSLPDKVDVILTGRNAPPELIDRADLVTECCEVKHPYHQGVSGSRSREF